MKKILSLVTVVAVLALSLISCGAEKSYEKLDAHITSSSTAQSGVHELVLGKTETDGVTYTRTARRSEGKIELILTLTKGDATLRSFSLTMNKESLDKLPWSYSSGVTGSSMSGIIDTDNYVKAAAALAYMDVSSTDEYEVVSMSEHSKALCNYLLESLKTDLSALELTAEDFGFEDFDG